MTIGKRGGDKIYYSFYVLSGDSLVVDEETILIFKRDMTFKNESSLASFIQSNGFCPICCGDLEPIYENNGFNEPDPTHYEITGYKPCKCQEELWKMNL